MISMKKTIGILAHVDAGKTTFSEQLLYHTKSIRERGRVDHKNSHLDIHQVEQQRGITVFADEAVFQFGDSEYTLIDTPGHVDFSAEMERSLLALDAAILLLDGSDGVQGHTDTIWSLLKEHQIPTILFINKMDQQSADLQRVQSDIQAKLSQSAQPLTDWLENVEDFAMLDESLMELFLEDTLDKGQWKKKMAEQFMACCYFPIISGSALKDEGIEWFLEVMEELLQPEIQQGEMQGVIYKIRHIEQNQRVAFVKIKQGMLKVRDSLQIANETHKITQLRKYNGTKFEERQEAFAGDCIAVIGLKNAEVGMTLGTEAQYEVLLIPTMRAKVQLDSKRHPKELLGLFRMIEVEDPALGVEWQEELQEINIKIMGKIQLEVIRQVFEERFAEKISFDQPSIIYKETVDDEVVGYGHFEPLKHYSEVHLQIKAAPRGSGVTVNSVCHKNDLAIGLQNAVAQYLQEGGHHGLLTGSEVTDLHITLLTGRAHQKHTEGGDFREASLRALRQGLEQASNRLLEPYYAITMKADLTLLGRMMTDLKRFHATIDVPETVGDLAIISGRAPVALLMDYPTEFASYTNGRGSIQFRYDGYDECHNTDEIVERIGYQKDADALYTSNSVFCEKGKGYTVQWQDAKQAMHCPINE